MRKLKVLVMMLCIAAVGLATSCYKENKAADIIGYWKCTHSIWHYTCTSHGETREDITRTDECVGDTWQFTEDGRLYAEGEEDCLYEVQNGNLILTILRYGICLTKEFKIEKLTDKTLTLHIQESEMIEGDDEYTKKEWQWLEFERI